MRKDTDANKNDDANLQKPVSRSEFEAACITTPTKDGHERVGGRKHCVHHGHGDLRDLLSVCDV